MVPESWLHHDAVQAIRSRQFADPPYLNLLELLDTLSDEPTTDHPNIPQRNLGVEIQVISRRSPFAILAGIPRVLEMLEKCVGEWSGGRRFAARYEDLDIWSLDDGHLIASDGVPVNSLPRLSVSGTYAIVAHLNTL